MPILTKVVTDGITAQEQRVVVLPLDPVDVQAFVDAHNATATFEGCIRNLERTCLDVPGRRINGDETPPAYGSEAWYAEEILLAIHAARHWLAHGQPDVAAAEAVRVGALAAEAKATHEWPVVPLGVKNRDSTKKAARTRGRTIAASARALDLKIKNKLAVYKASDERLTVRKLAKDLDCTEKTIRRHLTTMGIAIADR